jgi:hypothetical protein
VKPRTFSLRIVSSTVLAVFLAGCASSHKIKVDALTQPGAENSISYRIKSTNPAFDPEGLRHKEAEKFVKTALSGKGLYEAPNPEAADMVVNIDYGISPPKVSQELHREPMYRMVPGRTRTERVIVGYTKSGSPIMETVIYQDPPTQEYVGDREYIITIVTYEKFLRLSARSNTPPSEGRPPEEVWTVDVVTEGESRDLRKALPVLAAATIEFVGKDSKGQKTIRLKDKDEAIAFVKRGL